MQTALDSEMAWRIKELNVFKTGAGKNGPQRAPFARAGVALLYAHWEGFIKRSSEIYLSYVESRALRFRDLKSCFIVLGIKSRIHALVAGKKAAANTETVEFILSELDQHARLNIASAIDTRANLTSAVFANIAASLDINLSSYETKFKLIDSSLVNRRNKIAHGEFIDIAGREFSELVDEILALMRSYKTDIENAASQELYCR
ncbi:MAG: MAE_28990/MAE_18760 family HEPN-like nuclease [Pseudomonadota bacterium]